jgi:hypothetical protein
MHDDSMKQSGSKGLDSLMDLSIFAPDLMTSGQYFGSMGGRGVHTPEKRMILTILEDAIRCALGTSVSADDHGLGRVPGRKRKLYAEALDWIAGAPALVGFDFACEVLGIDPEWLRRGIHALPAGTRIDRRTPPTSGSPKIGSGYVRRSRAPKFGMAPRVKKTSAFSPLTGQQAFVMDGLVEAQ